MDEAKFRIGQHVVIGGVTALKGQSGAIRGVRRAGGEERHYFVYLDERHWPLIPENGIWVIEHHLSEVE